METRRFATARALRAASFALGTVLALSGGRAAIGQTACQGSIGPDIIVGDVIGPANYNSAGTLEALTLGVRSCSMGTVWINVFHSTNQHPVYASALYRLKSVGGADRFEQVGQGWVFHSFFALSSQLCCTGCQATDGTHLGVNCSDSNTASRAGQQSVLGPKWEVNAHTGDFAMPHANPPFAGSTARRIQVDMADLEPTGGAGAARYFGEIAYVAPDDSAAGNQDNNASYREVGVTGSGTAWNFALMGTTAREQPAIRAWRDVDPTVSQVDVRVPGEGLMILAWKVTPLGGGVWHYEYALQNRNSDASAGSVQIQVPVGVNAFNVEFHDVDYRDGDGIGDVSFDGTDWPPTFGTGVLIWGTTPFATDPSANALRWGTTYNFRFDADSPPAPGLLTVGLFKTSGQVTVATEVPAGTPPGAAFCRGDGADPFVTTPCPCANFGAPGHGCANSQSGSAGAVLASSGIQSPDTVVLTASEMLPTSLCIFLQGNGVVTGGLVFGDGVRCAGGALKRLDTKGAVGGVASYPESGDPSITVRSAALGDPIPSGATRWYQVYYRDPDLTFCPAPAGSTFGVTSGQSIIW